MRVDQKLPVASFIERGLCIIPGSLKMQECASLRKQKHKKGFFLSRKSRSMVLIKEIL